jgi:hypothetical protein
LGGHKRTDAGVIASLLGAATDKEASIVDLRGRLPTQNNLAIAGRGGEADQGDGGAGGHGGQAEKQ